MSDLKKVLIITYYWPPAGGPGVQRVLKFAKYLPEFGWQPLVLTVRHGEYPALDGSLAEEIPSCCRVYRTSSWEPYFLYKKFTGMKTEERIPVAVVAEKEANWKRRLSNWIRLNLFVPDARVGWKPFAVKEGKKIIEGEKPDVIFSSSPPPTVHLIAKKLAAWSGIKWVSDFRDPWTGIYHYDKAKRNPLSEKYDKYLERKTLRSCDRITVTSDGFFPDLENQKKISFIPNGFDMDDMIAVKDTRNSKFTIRYMGSMKSHEHVDSFFCVLKELSEKEDLKKSVKLDIIGKVSPFVIEAIEKKEIALEWNLTGYLEHQRAIHLIANSDLLLFIIGPGTRGEAIITGKLFEYLMVQKPIIAYGPLDGAANRILKKTGAGRMFDYEAKEEVKTFILELYHKWRRGSSGFKLNFNEIKKYDRKALTQRLVRVFEGSID